MRNQWLHHIERTWMKMVRGRFGDGTLCNLLVLAGPFAILSGILMFLCIIFAVAYKRKHHTAARLLASLSGVVAIAAAIAWRVVWFDISNYMHDSVIGNLIVWAPVALVAIVVLCMLRKVRKASKDEAFLAQREAARAQKETERGQREAERQRASLQTGTVSGALPTVAPNQPPQIGTDEFALEKIRALHDLLKSGSITQADFDLKKLELLERM